MPKYVAIREIVEDKVPVGALELAGWIRTHRQSKRVSFIELSDGTSVSNLQLVVDPQLPGYADVAPKLATGTSISSAISASCGRKGYGKGIAATNGST